MATLTIKKDGINEIKKNLSSWKKAQRKKARKVLQNIGEDMVAEIIDEIEEAGATDTRNLVASIAAKKPILTKTFMELKILSDAAYAGIIEYGRRPDQPPPPIEALVGWAARNGITQNIPITADLSSDPYEKSKIAAYIIMNNARDNPGKNTKEEQKLSGKNADIISDFMILIAISRSIGVLGQKGKYPFTTVMEKRKKTIVKDFKEYFDLLS